MNNISSGPIQANDETHERKPEHAIYLSLGSNLGQRQENLVAALAQLCAFITLQQISSLYETVPVGYLDQPPFFNVACSGYTSLSPQELLARAKSVEHKVGRRATFHNGPRIVDIDVLMYDNLILTQEDLVLPHPRMRERAFVLVPFAEIAPTLRDPVSGNTIAKLQHMVGNQGVAHIASNWLPTSY